MKEVMCPKCNGKTRKHGFKPLRNRNAQQYQCKACGFVFHLGEAKIAKELSQVGEYRIVNGKRVFVIDPKKFLDSMGWTEKDKIRYLKEECGFTDAQIAEMK